jgi:tetratricopeptide (TPR) repeat protein
LYGTSAPAHIHAARAAFDAGKAELLAKHFEAAVQHCRKAIEIEPTFLEAHQCLIGAYTQANDRLDAAAAITRFLEIEPESREYRLVLAQILLDEKEYARALAQFSLLLKRDPFDADALFGFSSAARHSGMEDRAAQALELGRRRHPGDERFRLIGRNE